MKLKLAKQSGWLTQEEYDEELKQSIHYWNCNFREAAYDLDAEDYYYDDDGSIGSGDIDDHDGGHDSGHSHDTFIDNGDQKRYRQVNEEESRRMHASVPGAATRSQDPSLDNSADLALEPSMPVATEPKHDDADIST